MNGKMIWKIPCLVLLLGCVLYGTGAAIDGWDISLDERFLSEKIGSQHVSFSNSYSRNSTLSLTPFQSIQVNVIAADIRVVVGDQWKIDYSLSNIEKPIQCEVRNGTLYFETTKDQRFSTSHRNRYVTITVPRLEEFQNISLTTVSGDIELESVTTQSARFKTTSGDVELDQVTAQQLDVKCISGSVETSQCRIDSLGVDIVSGDIEAHGDFDRLSLKTVSGDSLVVGTIGTSCSIDGVSGDMEVRVPHSLNISARTRGEITVNNSGYERQVEIGNNGPRVEIKSTTGDISIDDCP